MKKIFYSLLLLSATMVVSCKKDITDLNINPTRPPAVTSAALFSNASLNFSDLSASTNVNVNNFRLFVQHWTETIYRDETRYNLNGRSITDRWWAILYRDVIKDLTEANNVLATETSLSAGQIKNRKAINEILIVHAYYYLITSFGDVPYTEALDIENLQPKYEDAATIFGKIATRLDSAIAQLDEAEPSYGSADFILNGDVNGWEMFGQSLKLKMGMLVVDSDPATASKMIVEAAPAVVSSNAENIKINYLASPPNTNPVWEDLVQGGRHDFVAAKPFIDTLKAYNDPRLPFYFNKDIATGASYIGQTPGTSATYNNFSAPSTTISEPEFPHTFFSYAEMELYKAEAAARGIPVGGTAEEHYNNAIDASIMEWGGTQAQAQAYRSQPKVKYTTAPGNFKQKIGLQSWIILYNRGFDAWTQWRRLDYPILNVPNMGATNPFATDETPSVIKRLTYPVVEQNLNKANYNAASGAIGKDQITQRLWFDKF
jgi:hypothetical protein